MEKLNKREKFIAQRLEKIKNDPSFIKALIVYLKAQEIYKKYREGSFRKDLGKAPMKVVGHLHLIAEQSAAIAEYFNSEDPKF